MAPDGPGAGARRIQQHRIERGGRGPAAQIGGDQLGRQPEPGEVPGDPFEPPGRNIERRHLRPRGGELRGLAAWRRAEIGDPPALDTAVEPREQGARGERRSRVLYPPAAGFVAGQAVHPRRRAPQAAGREHGRVEPRRPAFGRLGRGDIERRFRQMGHRDRPRHRLAIGPGPAAPEPVRGVEPGGVLGDAQPRAVAGEAAEDGVGEAAIAPRRRCVEQRHRLVDRGMGGGPQKDDIGGAQPERVSHRSRAVGQGPADKGGEQCIDLTEAAQRRRRQMAHQRPVALVERQELGRSRERPVERYPVVQHRIEQRMRDRARLAPRRRVDAVHSRSPFGGWQPLGRQA